MDTVHPTNPANKLLTLPEAAQKLAVSIDTLLEWNQLHILKPTITQTGQIGYTQAQIDEFLSIKQSLQECQVTVEPIPQPTLQPPVAQSISVPTPTQTTAPLQETIRIQKDKPSQPGTSNWPHINTASYFKYTASFLVLVAVVGVVSLTNQEALMTFVHSFEQDNTDSKNLHASSLSFDQPVDSSLQTHGGKVENGTSSSIFADKKASFLFREKNIAETVATSIMATMSAVAFNQTAEEIKGVEAVLGESFASVAFPEPDETDVSSALDNRGNIRGEEGTVDTLAMILGGSPDVINTPSQRTSPDYSNQFVLLAIFSVAIWFLLKKPHETHVHTSTVQATPAAQKIFEVDQKMDGTVVVHFQGNIYKICKPELYSDSDRFIERLMSLSQTNVKEMDYDSSEDEELCFEAPLSRLVTRLGFVGIKRDLFFPRTSKNRVLFRKYVTQDDLTAMNLTTDDILKDLTSQTS